MDIRDFVFLLVFVLVIVFGLALYVLDAIKTISRDVIDNKNVAKYDYRYLNNRINDLMVRVNSKKDEDKNE